MGRVWSLAGKSAPDTDGQATVDLDGFLVTAHIGRSGDLEERPTLITR